MSKTPPAVPPDDDEPEPSTLGSPDGRFRPIPAPMTLGDLIRLSQGPMFDPETLAARATLVELSSFRPQRSVERYDTSRLDHDA